MSPSRAGAQTSGLFFAPLKRFQATPRLSFPLLVIESNLSDLNGFVFWRGGTWMFVRPLFAAIIELVLNSSPQINAPVLPFYC